MDAIKKLRNDIDHKQVELEQAQRQGNWELAARIQYGEMRELQAKLTEAETRLKQLMGQRYFTGEGGSRRRADCRGGQPLERCAGHAHAGRRKRKTDADGAAARQARHRPGKMR